MNSRKDIILVILGALLLVAGAVVLLTPGLVAPVVPDEAGKAAAITLLKEAAPRGEAYPSTPRASLEDNVLDWPTPEENDDNWDYDLFTTIDVVWDSAIKEYVPRSRKAEEMPPFGIALVSAGHPTYTFMLIQSTLAPGKKEEERLFDLKNVKTKQYLDGCKLNMPIADAPYLTLKSYKVVKGKDADGIPFTRNLLTVDDRQFGQIVEINDEKPTEFTARTDIIISSTSDPTWTLTLHAVGDKFTYNGAQYVVKDIDLPNKSVSFDKTFALNPKKPKKLTSDPQTLTVPAPPPPVAKPKTPSPATKATTPKQ
ncbi:MAG: hypothetical protein CAK86_00850 [Opitutia bacterium AMD-G1]|jgi:hypothetical protein|nr:MAG: hypothetical protein CAK86_00850 [Opitutae bacterium AMD-G1]